MHGLWHCVIRVYKDSGVMGVGKDSAHGTWEKNAKMVFSKHGLVNDGDKTKYWSCK